MSTLNSKNYDINVFFGNVQAFFSEHFKNHINNQLEWINKSSLTDWNGENLYVYKEDNMYNYITRFVFLRVPLNLNKQVWVNMDTCIIQPFTNTKNQQETQIFFNQ